MRVTEIKLTHKENVFTRRNEEYGRTPSRQNESASGTESENCKTDSHKKIMKGEQQRIGRTVIQILEANVTIPVHSTCKVLG